MTTDEFKRKLLIDQIEAQDEAYRQNLEVLNTETQRQMRALNLKVGLIIGFIFGTIVVGTLLAIKIVFL